MSDARRVRHRVTGVVQGVGFRPHVFRLAGGLGLAGHVGNDSDGVFIEVEGPSEALRAFAERLRSDAPPLARIHALHSEPVEPTGGRAFEIVDSRPIAGGLTLVSPDLAPCDACLAEMADPADRRHRYPFLNCTDCGPRFTITRGVPYDRPQTTMANFRMCRRCRAEYDDPTDRRFHAQPTACPACGPVAWLEAPAGRRLDVDDPLRQAVRLVDDGAILAIKGVGGYHLACRADLDAPVRALRDRKQRPHKPLAVMVVDVATARTIAHVEEAEARLLQGPERPIVLLRARSGIGLSALVAPGNALVGVMLPSSPLHALLLTPGAVWVMTSGNRSSEPICTDDDQARDALGGIADAFLCHNRPIHVPCDDSVVRVLHLDGPAVLPVRRSRGYAPYPVPVSFAGPPILAVGGELKATFCLTRGGHAFMSQHIGDMENLETLDAFERAVEHLTGLFATQPEVLASDTHPGYLSVGWARRLAGDRPLVTVQHHHAHLAALMAEHRIDGPIIGFSFDGTGYGDDGTIWGGEVMVADLLDFERVGHLRPALLAGGDLAVRRPYRQALARMVDAGVEWGAGLAPVRAATAEELRVLPVQLERRVQTTDTTSMGRLFDAVASLCGVRQHVTYEGQAAIELEAVAGLPSLPGPNIADSYRIPIDEAGEWDTRPLIRAVAADVARGAPAHQVSARFHVSVAAAMTEAAERVRATHGLRDVGLSGGVFGNVVLTTHAHRALTARGFRVLTHRLVPSNDGGLALGQAAVAAATISGR